MQEYAQEIISEVERILEQHKGFILFSQVASSLSKGLRNKLCIKSNTSPQIIRKKLMPVIEENFIIRKKSNYTYVLTPCEVEDLVLAQLSETKPMPLGELVRMLKPFRKPEVTALLTDMVNAGKVRVKIEESYILKIFAWGAGHRAVRESRQVQAESQAQAVQTFRPEDYTQAKFRRAYDELHVFREFIRICDLRRALNWPREVFDQMIRTLRDNRIIRVIIADESELTQDEIRDCFIDENKTLMGLITWNGR
ncbi:MAG: hypothetical protein IJS39_11900 [Synergistaceae bacterium]|nr:hypothetical protein [Synergistaceae bacterium]